MAAVSNNSDFVPCPHCGTRLRRGMIRCRDCGGVVAEDFVLAEGVRVTSPARQCRNCGTELDPGATDCPQCASEMLDELLNKSAPEEQLPELPPLSSEFDLPAIRSASLDEHRTRSTSSWEEAEDDTAEAETDRPAPVARRQNRPMGPHVGKRGRRTAARHSTGRNRNTEVADEDALEYLTLDDDSPPPEPSRWTKSNSSAAASPPAGKPSVAKSDVDSPSTPSSDTSAACAALVMSLSSGDINLRCQAATALASFGNQDAVAPLERLLVDSEVQVRRAAAEALIQLGHPKGEALRAVAERKPAGAAIPSNVSGYKNARRKRDWSIDLGAETKSMLVKGGGIAAGVVVLIGGILLMNGTMRGWKASGPTAVPIGGNVTTSSGSPVTGVRLILAPDNGDVLSTFGFDLDQKGHFTGEAIPGSYKFYFAPISVERNEDDGHPVNKDEAKKLKDSNESLSKLVPAAYRSPKAAKDKVHVTAGADVSLVLSK